MATGVSAAFLNCSFLFVLAVLSASVLVGTSAEQTKTVEFNVKPGGVVHTFSEGIVSNGVTLTLITYSIYPQYLCLF